MSSAIIPLGGFKDCDIRGEVDHDITPELAYRLGRAVATALSDKSVVIGGDFRLSTPLLMTELRRGLVESGARVFDLGQLSTPGYYFGHRYLGIGAGVMITASHSPANWNGFKPILGDYPITPEQLEELKSLALNENFTTGSGSVESVDVKDAYVSWLADRFAGLGDRLGPVILDCGNGATGWVIREVVTALRVQGEVLFPETDGRFPSRSPDISRPGDLAILEAEVRMKRARMGFGFDGDGDRVGMVDERGARVPSDRLIAWLAGELLQRAGSGSMIYDLKLSRLVPETVERHGGVAIAQKSGHTFIKASVLQQNAVMGGEYSGHLFYRELDGSDDGLFSALLIASLIVEDGAPVSEIMDRLPHYFSTPDLRIHASGDKGAIIEQAAQHALQAGAHLIRVDGVRAEFGGGWALMRTSVTEPAFTFRFEGKTREDMLAVALTFLEGIPDQRDAVWQQILRHSSNSH